MGEPGGKGRTKVVRDARELRAMAHPIRHRLLEELLACGHASVGQLAERIGEPANSVSYHLRQLARYGFIDLAPELARDGRECWWRISYSDGYLYADELMEVPAARALLTELAGAETRRRLEGIARAFPVPCDAPDRHARDWWFRMTRAEADEFNQDLIELLQGWSARSQDAAAREVAADQVAAPVEEGNDVSDLGGPERMTLAFFSFLFPADAMGAVAEPTIGTEGGPRDRGS